MKFILRAAIAGYFLLLILLIIGSTGWVAVNWPFELFLSYIRHVIVTFPIVILTGWMMWKKSAPALLILSGIAFLPFFLFGKYVSPDDSDCVQAECLIIVSSNLRKRHKAVERLAANHAVQSADFIGLYEIPFDYNEARLEKLFPDFEFVHLMRRSPHDDTYIGSFIAILSKHPPSQDIYNGVSPRPNPWVDRGYIIFPIEVDGDTIPITALHTRLPLSYGSAQQRNRFLEQITQHIEDQENYIYMGDFNLTPWTPEFRKLPGKRAGDPRFISTWDAQRFWTGIPIDHIMISDGIEVIESRVLEDVGSDHFPVFAKVKIRK